jgi:hypothetical protein
MGTGSPNTVTRWLETWWGRLGERLADHRLALSLPEAPAAVASLASQWWELALSAATAQAESIVEQERSQLAVWRDELQAQTQHNQRALEEAERQLVVRDEQINVWAQRAADWDVERAHMRAEIERLAAIATLERQALDGLRSAHATLRQQADAEREVAAEHIRRVEDRAHLAVDEARQEVKALRTSVTAAAREAARKDTVLAKQQVASARALATAERDALAARTKAQTLEAALSTFKASMRSAEPKPNSRRRKSTAKATTSPTNRQSPRKPLP